MRIVHADTGKFQHIRRISFYSIDHDDFNPAPTTGNILLKDPDGPLPPGNYLLPDLGGIRIFIRVATETNEFAVPQPRPSKGAEGDANERPRNMVPFTPVPPAAGSNP